MQKIKQSPATKNVVPFTGEFYPQSPDIQPPDRLAPVLLTAVAALVAGVAFGAIAAYQNPAQVQLRQLQSQVKQLEQVKIQLCK